VSVDRALSANGQYVVTLTQTKAGVDTSYTRTIAVGTGGATGEGTGTDSQSNCGTDFLLHPSYITCWLKWLFVPSGTAIADKWTSVQSAATGNWPLGPMVWVKDQLSATAGALQAGTTGDVTAEGLPLYTNEGSNTCEGIVFHIGFGRTDVPDQKLGVGNVSDSSCSDPKQEAAVSTFRHVVYLFSTVAFGLLFVIAVFEFAYKSIPQSA
jgi:hypothetical protein